MNLTPRERILAAYTGQPGDFVPVAPEFWYDLPARVLDTSIIGLELEVPHWQALGGRVLQSRRILNKLEPSWHVECYIKDFDRDWPAYLELALAPPVTLDWTASAPSSARPARTPPIWLRLPDYWTDERRFMAMSIPSNS